MGMSIRKWKKLLLGAAAGLLAVTGTVTASFPAFAQEEIRAVD